MGLVTALDDVGYCLQTVSIDFFRLRLRLLVLAQVRILSISLVRELMLLAGITRQVSYRLEFFKN